MNTAMKPNFTDRSSYLGWRQLWRITHARLSQDIRRLKVEAKEAQRADPELARKKQRELHFNRRVAYKLMTLLQDGHVRRDRILSMHRELASQPFPLEIGDARNVDFHFNKGHVDFPFLPMWVIRAKGRSYYVNDVDFDVPCTTKERATGSTKGVLRFRRCSIKIDKDGYASVSRHYNEVTEPLPAAYSAATS